MKPLVLILMNILFLFGSCSNASRVTNPAQIDSSMDSGSGPESTEIAQPNCKTKAIVKDMTGLDGCGLVFTLENGETLLPENLTELDLKLHDGQEVRINYTLLKDRVSACMAGKIVSIDCLEELPKK